MKAIHWVKGLGLGALLVLSAGIAHADAEYTMHGRVSYDAGSNLIKGHDDTDWSHATVNTLILPGDTLVIPDTAFEELHGLNASGQSE